MSLLDTVKNFQEDYARMCADSGSPLNSTQLGALETAIETHFGFNPKQGALAEQEIDGKVLRAASKLLGGKRGDSEYYPNFIASFIREYHSKSDLSNPTNQEALALYQRSLKAIEQNEKEGLEPFDYSNFSDRPKKFSLTTFLILQEYLIRVEMVAEETRKTLDVK